MNLKMLNFALKLHVPELLFILLIQDTAGQLPSLRKPRLVLKTGESGTVLYFYNHDVISNSHNIEDAVNCSVKGDHIIHTEDGWKPEAVVSLKCLPESTVLYGKKIPGMGESDIVQTFKTCYVTYNVEGYFTCRDTLGMDLFSNTILLRLKNHETAVVRLMSNMTTEELLKFVEGYAYSSFFSYTGRLYYVSDNGSQKEAVIRVSNSEDFDQTKLISNVNELTIYLAKENNVNITHEVRSTRSCLPVSEGNFSWPLTSVGRSILPENPCFDVNRKNTPKRKCLGDFFEGAYWDDLPELPHLCSEIKTTSKLLKIVNTLDRKNTLDNLLAELSQMSELSPVQIYSVSETLKKTALEVSSTEGFFMNISTVVSVVDAILHAGSQKIKMADETYGSSGSLLDSINMLVAATASPFPTPVSRPSFSAFSATPGTGVLGFAFKKRTSEKDEDKMFLFDKHNNLSSGRKFGPSVVMHLLGNEANEIGIVVTLFQDETLFNAAKMPTMKLEGPIFGVKLFQRVGLKNLEPVLIIIKFRKDNSVTGVTHCVSWEPSRDGGWSSANCIRISSSDVFVCTVPTTSELYFTLITDETLENFTSNAIKLGILPMKSNVGALLHLFGKVSNTTHLTEMNCYVKQENNDTEHGVSFENVTEIIYFRTKKVTVLKITNYTAGYLQCRIRNTVISNKIRLHFPNTVTLSLTAPVSINAEEVILNYTNKNLLNLHFTKISQNNETGEEEFRFVQQTEEDHLDFIEGLRYMFRDLKNSHNLTLINLMSNRFCLSQDGDQFTWPNTKMNQVAAPINPCLDEYGAPILARRCLGDYEKGLYWEPEPSRPHLCNQISDQAEHQQNFGTKSIETDIFEELLGNLQEESTSSDVKASLLSMGLNNVAKEVSDPSSETPKPNITSIANVVNAIIAAKIDSDKESITISSGDILDSIDILLEKSSADKPVGVVTDHFSAMVAGPGSSLRGFYEPKKFHDDASDKIEPILNEVSIEDALPLALHTGALLIDPPDDIGLTYTIFNDDTLFADDKYLKLSSSIIGIKMIGNKENDTEVDSEKSSVLLFFDKDDSESGRRRNCYFWDTKENKWSREGCSRVYSCGLPGEIPVDKDACLCTHLTHFAMLVSTVEHEEDDVLHMLTLVGCALSLASLFGIFLIAIFSPEWRRGASRKVQMSLSASLALLMASYLAVATTGECPPSMVTCITLGALLHYSVLASFSWMLVAAMLQVFRLTPSMAMDARRRAGTHLVLKTSVFGWGIPMIPVAITLCCGTDQYSRRKNSSLCYPTGRAFYTAVLFPVALSITLNTIVFIWLMRMLFCNKFKEMRVHHKAKNNQEIRRYFSALFLFCLLGITWLSGIAVEITVGSETMSKILSYAFCATATLQGTSLFIFFVACERNVGSKMCKAFPTAKRGGQYSRAGLSVVTYKTTTVSDLKQ